jgi:hypothetical protein
MKEGSVKIIKRETKYTLSFSFFEFVFELSYFFIAVCFLEVMLKRPKKGKMKGWG